MEPPRLSSFKEDAAAMDRVLLACALALTLWGILCIYSAAAGPHGRGGDFALRQFGFLGLSVATMFAILAIGCHRLLDAAYPLYAFTLFVLLATVVLAPKVKGAHSWMALGGFRFQPSEFAKVSLILMLSKVLSRYPPLSIRTFAIGVGAMLPAVLLVLMQPDAGSALVYLVISFGMIFAAGAPIRYFLAIGGAGVLMLPFLWLGLKEYQKMRLLVFLDPMLDPLGAGYNVIQSRIAVGSGGFWGKGFLLGMQSKLRFLPEPHTDFIFSVSSEEFGFLGGIVVLLLFTVLFCRIVGAGLKSRDRRAKLIAAGVVSWIWVQTFESIGMSVGLMPVTGLPLPFLSYGGSSLLSLFMGLGLVGSVYVEGVRRPYYF